MIFKSKSQIKRDLFNMLDVLLIICIGAIFLIGIFIILIHRDTKSDSDFTIEEEPPIVLKNPFDELSLKARAVYVYDALEQKVLYAHNEHVPLPLASLTKIMTAITATDLVPSSTVITIQPESLKEEGDTGLKVLEKWSLKNLLDFTLLVSSNDGAHALASVATSIHAHEEKDEASLFIEAMNKKATSLGLSQTHFYNSTGLDQTPHEPGAYGSAHDMAKLFEYSLRNYSNILEATRYPELVVSSLNEIDHYVKNTNSSVSEMPGLIASKTGFSDLAGGNLVVAFDAGLNHPIIISILGSGYEERFEDIKMLIKATQEVVARPDI